MTADALAVEKSKTRIEIRCVPSPGALHAVRKHRTARELLKRRASRARRTSSRARTAPVLEGMDVGQETCDLVIPVGVILERRRAVSTGAT